MRKKLPDCYHRGREVAPGFFECGSNRLIHSIPGVCNQMTCLHPCPYANYPNSKDQPQVGPVNECDHRGIVIRVEQCRLCGNKKGPVQVFSCRVHGECTIGSHGVRKGGELTAPKVAVCIGCDDREA